MFALFCVVAAPSWAQVERPLTADDFIQFDPKQAELGQLLFYDRILSGNKNIACSTCHHPDLGTGDGLSLGIGEGGAGLGALRTAGIGDDQIKKRIPRNAPGLWNLGAKDINVMFHDGRLSISDAYASGFDSPAEEWLPVGFNSLLAAQAVFPLVAQFEMAGNPRENEIAGAVHNRIDAAWPILAKRVRITGDYGARFVAAFSHIEQPEDVTIVEIANALAAFMGTEWQSFDSPYDRFVAGDLTALSDEAQRGKDIFFGKGNCAICHAGPLFSDQSFHALGLPPFGPGRTRAFDPVTRDVGRMGESDRLEDAYRFRTPMLRNVALTAPYGHNGAYPTLGGIIRHHVDPVGSFASWTPEMAALPDAPAISAIDFVVWNDRFEMARQTSVNDLKPVAVTDADIAALEAFLHGLTGEIATKGRLGIPVSVPSGLPVDRTAR
ncbi:MAG: cytochrome-c peroxidase [Sulfitobacter sp.]